MWFLIGMEVNYMKILITEYNYIIKQLSNTVLFYSQMSFVPWWP